MKLKYQRIYYVWAILRIFLGLIFLWAFFDKVFGLGFATASENAWIRGKSPTSGFLSFATRGPFSSFYQNLAGSPIVDWIFMIGLLLIGLGLTLGIMVKLASLCGALMLFLMWTAVLPPENHPFLDSHIIYLIVMIGFIIVHAGKYFGLGTWWTHLVFVKKHPVLE